MPVLNRPEAPKKAVIAMKVVSFLSLCAGIYNEDLISNNRFKWMSRLYCLLYNAFFLTMITNDPYMPIPVKCVIWMDTIPYAMFYLLNKASALNYLRQVASGCKNAKEDRWLWNSILFPIWLALGNFVIDSVLLSATINSASTITRPVAKTAFQIFGTFAGELKTVTKFFHLCLLVCDLNLLQARLREVGFGVRSEVENSRLDYVNMFQNIRIRFQHVEMSTKVLILLHTSHCIALVITVLVNVIVNLREDGLHFVAMTDVGIIFFKSIHTFTSVFILEAVADAEEKIITYVLDLYISCPNRSERNEMRRLARYMRAEPLRFTLWRVVPLNSTLAIGFISLVVTYIIAVLQFK